MIEIKFVPIQFEYGLCDDIYYFIWDNGFCLSVDVIVSLFVSTFLYPFSALCSVKLLLWEILSSSTIVMVSPYSCSIWFANDILCS